LTAFSDIPTGRGEESAKFWNQELLAAAEHEREWRERSSKIVKMLRCEDYRGEASRRANMLWATNQVLAPAIYSQTPTVDVRRRYFEAEQQEQQQQGIEQQQGQQQQQQGQQQPSPPDPARIAVDVLEKALTAQIDVSDFDEAMEACRDDLLNVGRGVSWVAYNAETKTESVEAKSFLGSEDLGPVFFSAESGDVVDESAIDIAADGALSIQSKVHEELRADFVIWTDYRESPARRWSDVWWVARKHRMTKRDVEEQFSSGAAKQMFDGIGTQLGSFSDEDPTPQDATKEPKSVLARQIIWEIWCKPTRQRIWLQENGKTLLKRKGALEGDEVPIDLQEFFPCPRPVYAVTTTDSRVPIPEFQMWEDDARDLDLYMTRAAAVVEAIKAVLLCDGEQMAKMPDVRDAEDGTVISAGRMPASATTLAQALFAWPVADLAKVLVMLQEMIDAKKAVIFEKTGVSDLARGMTDPGETASAQRLKGAFGQFRMAPRAKPFQRMVRDTLRIMAEVISEHYDAETLEEMTGQPVTPDVLQILRDDRTRSLRIDIETDSTVRPDVEQLQAQAVQFVEANANFIGQFAQFGAIVPEFVPYLGEVLKAAIRPFKFGRQAEDVLEEAVEAIKQGSAQRREQAPQPDPEVMLKAQAEQGKLQLEAEKLKLQAMELAASILQSETQRDDQLLNQAADRELQREQRRTQNV
jgi:hypothetical protein